MNRKRSAVWMFFDAEPNDKAKCNICRTILSHKGGATSNLRKHVMAKHPTAWTYDEAAAGPSQIPKNPAVITVDLEKSPVPNQVSTVQSAKRPKQTSLAAFMSRPMSLDRQKKQDILLLKMVVRDLQPFSIVDDVGFRAYSVGLDPTYTMPSRMMLSRSLLPQMYNDMVIKVRQELEVESQWVTLTTDTWTSSCTEGFMAVTAHYISNDWRLKSMLLECFKFDDRHTAENLRNELIRVAKDWHIERKIVAVVSDNAANIVKAVRLTGWMHLGCVAHTLNLVVQTAVSHIKPLQHKIKSIVEHFHRSTVAADKLKEMQKNMLPDQDPLKLIMDVATRWNSTYYMIERVCLIQEPLEAAIAVLHAGLPTIGAGEWVQLKECCTVLKPMLEATEELSAEKNVSASKVIVMLHGVMKAIKNKQKDCTGSAKDLAKSLLDGLSLRFANMERSEIFAPATFLDPRFKKNGFDDLSMATTCKENLIKKMQHENCNEETEDSLMATQSLQVEVSDSIWGNFLQKVSSQRPSTSTSAILEMRQYSEDGLINLKGDPLKWWKSREGVLPRLSKIAKKNLCIVATSVPSERIFSKAGQLISDRRNRLKASKVQQILFLNANQDYF